MIPKENIKSRNTLTGECDQATACLRPFSRSVFDVHDLDQVWVRCGPHHADDKEKDLEKHLENVDGRTTLNAIEQLPVRGCFKAEYNLYTIRPQCAERPWTLIFHVQLEVCWYCCCLTNTEIWQHVKIICFLCVWDIRDWSCQNKWRRYNPRVGVKKAGVQKPVLTSYSPDPML